MVAVNIDEEENLIILRFVTNFWINFIALSSMFLSIRSVS